MSFLASIVKPALDFALPPRCPICGESVEDDHQFCLPCWQKLEFISEPWCASCGAPFSFERPQGTVCTQCLTDPPEHDGVRAVVRYADDSALLAIRLKYGTRLGLADLIAQQMERFLEAQPDDAVIVPVPLHRWRIWSRGFNQAVLIGRKLASIGNLSMALDVIYRTRATPPLREMTAKQRRRTVKNVFSLSDQAEAIIAGKTILLVDDIYTSGSTANACAKLLKQAGAHKVLVFCWARVLKDVES